MKEAIPAIAADLREQYAAIKQGTPDNIRWSDEFIAGLIERLAQAEHPSVPSDLAPLWEELQAVARTGGATVAAETCMGLIKRVWAAEHERDAMQRENEEFERKFSKREAHWIRENARQQTEIESLRAALAAEPGEERKS